MAERADRAVVSQPVVSQPDDSAPYAALEALIDNGLLSIDEFLGGEYRIVDLSRRNQNFVIQNGAGEGFFIKRGIDQGTRLSLAREAAFCESAAHAPGCESAAACMPELLSVDEIHSVYVYRLIGHAQALRTVLPSVAASRKAFRALGEALVKIHAAPLLEATGASRRKAFPLVFALRALPAAEFATLSPASFEFVRIVQASSVLLRAMEKASDLWRSCGVVHFDMRLENVLVERSGSVRILDWEFAGSGDPLWDIASVLSELICEWIWSVGGKEVGGSLPKLEFVQSLAAEFMSRSIAADERLGVYILARVLQTIYEQSSYYSRFRKDMVLGLQFCENVAGESGALLRVLGIE